MTEQPIKRNRYFDPPSTECSFNGETYDQDLQNFHLRSAQTQSASLHNWGIVQGLEVSGTLGSNTITINGGVALDAQGSLIVLATEGRGDLGTNPPGNNHDIVLVPVEFNTSSLAATSYYLTIQFSEYTNYNDPGSDICGRLEQAPWLRLQPVSGFTEDGTAVVLAVVTLDSAGNIVALAHQDSSLPVTRHLSGKTVGELQIRRSQTVGNAIAETNAGKLEALASGGLQLSVTNPGDQILLNQVDSSNFSSLSVQADTVTTPGNVGIGTATPSQKLEVSGAIAATALSVTDTVTANAFEGDGSALTGKVSTAGDTMTGSLTINADLTVNGAIITKQLSASSSGVEDDIEVTGTIDGRDISSDGVTLDNHVANTGNPHDVTAFQIGALSSIDGVSNPGGNIDLIRSNAITISPSNAANQITIGENHSGLGNNPHRVTASQIGALRTSGGSLTGSLTVSRTIFTDGNVQAKGTLFTDGNVQAKGTLFTDGQARVDGQVIAKGTIFTDVNVQAKGTIFTDGQVVAQGEIFGKSKHFVIDHPLDPTKNIVYTAIEGPEVAAYVRGQSKLVNGQAEIEFPEHFSLIVNSATITIQLTPHSADSKGLAVVSQSERGFCVRELWQGEGNYKFDYFVAGVRQGMEDFAPVVDKGLTALVEPMDRAIMATPESTVAPPEASKPD